MAVTWQVTITPLDVSRKTASIIGVRIDDDPETGGTSTHRIDTAILDTNAQKAAVRQQLFDMHLAHRSKNTATAAYIGSMEQDAKDWLEAQE